MQHRRVTHDDKSRHHATGSGGIGSGEVGMGRVGMGKVADG